MVTTDNITFTLVVTPPEDSETAITVDVDENVTDGAGNEEATQFVQGVDTLDPTVVITSDTPGAAADDFTLTFTFSEPVNGFTVDDVDLSSGTAGAFAGSDGESVFTLVVTPPGDSTTDIDVFVDSSEITDLVGNENDAGSFTQAVDTVAPTVVITSDTTVDAAGDFVLTFTFSEPVNGFTAGNVGLSGGTAGAFTGADGDTVFTLVVTPPAGSNDDITATVAVDVATDLAGNDNEAGTFTQAVDTRARIEFSLAESSQGESGVGDTVPEILVLGDLTGTTDAERTVNFSLTPGSATAGASDDFTLSASFIIPADNYTCLLYTSDAADE